MQSNRNDGSGTSSMQPLAEILRELLPGQRLVATSESTLRDAWPQVVGNLAARTSIVRFSDECLLVAVESAAWMTELSFHRDAIRARLLELGLVIREIRFVVAGRRSVPSRSTADRTTSPRRPKLTTEQRSRVRQATATVREPTLRKALERLFESALRDGERRSEGTQRKPE